VPKSIKESGHLVLSRVIEVHLLVGNVIFSVGSVIFSADDFTPQWLHLFLRSAYD